MSPESVDIYDFIIELHNSCLGNWKVLVEGGQTTQAELDAFLNYAATFLSNIGNYYVGGCPFRLNMSCSQWLTSHRGKGIRSSSLPSLQSVSRDLEGDRIPLVNSTRRSPVRY